MKAIITKKKNSKFTGCLKFSFTGKLNSVIESNGFIDIPITPADPETINNILEMEKESFYGTIVFELKEGVVTGYAYSKRLNYADM